MSDIAIVVRGADGTGRSQIVEIINRALTEQGFTNVEVVHSDQADVSAGASIKSRTITILEGR